LSKIPELAYSYFGLVGPVTVCIAGAIRMLRQLLVGIAVSVCNIAIHAIVMATVLWAARVTSERATSHQSLRLIAVMTATVTVLMAAHFAEVVVWTFAYVIVGVAPPGSDLLYFAFVNYTTLGYGDVTPLRRWQLLGPMTAMNGVLLFGWSTAVIFAVLRKAMIPGPTEDGRQEKGVSAWPMIE
jgi:hypothetical protein